MTTKHNDKTGLWTCTEGNITVSGPTRSGCEQRVRDLEERQQQIQKQNSPPVTSE